MTKILKFITGFFLGSILLFLPISCSQVFANFKPIIYLMPIMVVIIGVLLLALQQWKPYRIGVILSTLIALVCTILVTVIVHQEGPNKSQASRKPKKRKVEKTIEIKGKQLDKHCFNTRFKDFGEVTFITSVDWWAHFYLLRNNKIIYEFDGYHASEDAISPGIKEVRVFDANGDDKEDVLIMGTYKSAFNEDTSIDYPINRLLIAGDQDFYLPRKVNQLIASGNFASIEEINSFLTQFYSDSNSK